MSDTGALVYVVDDDASAREGVARESSAAFPLRPEWLLITWSSLSATHCRPRR